jgi:hypothetical protein
VTDPLSQFERLAEKARAAPIPPVDVSRRVVQTVRRRAAPASTDWPLWVSAGLSVAAAVFVMLFALQSGAFTTDPFVELVSQLTPVIP